MATSPEHRKNLLDAADAALTDIAGLPPHNLVRTNDLGSAMDFSVAQQDFEGILTLSRRVRGLDLRLLPSERLSALVGASQNARSVLDQVLKFSPMQDRAIEVRRQVIDEVESAHTTLYNVVAPMMVYLDAEADALSVRLATAFDEASKRAAAIGELEKRALLAVAAGEKAAGDAGITAEAAHFEAQATEHRDAGTRWLIAASGLAVLTAVIAWYSLYHSLDAGPDPGGGRALQLAVAKVALFSLLFTVLVAASKTYRAHRHNYVVNVHRRNALATFRAFVSAAGQDEAVKQAVLLQATSCIFAPQSSGFGGSKEVETPMSQIVETVRTLRG